MTRLSVQNGFTRQHLTVKVTRISCHTHTKFQAGILAKTPRPESPGRANTGPAEVLPVFRPFWDESASLGSPVPHHQENIPHKLGFSLFSTPAYTSLIGAYLFFVILVDFILVASIWRLYLSQTEYLIT
jgi:hypothetical protein